MAEEMENNASPEQPDIPPTTETLASEAILEETQPPERIGFGKRLGAYLLDAIFTLIASGVVGYALKDLFVGLVPIDPEMPEEIGELAAAITGAGGICAVLYGLIEGFTGASPGKMILAIKIGTDHATPAETNTLLTRYAIKTSSSIFALLGMILGLTFINTIGQVIGIVVFIGCFFALGATRQALHDKIVHTAVYQENAV